MKLKWRKKEHGSRNRGNNNEKKELSNVNKSTVERVP